MYDYLFCFRPSTICNMSCSYCYRHDNLLDTQPQSTFDIDSIIYHAKSLSNNLFNFCGYGETMIHPQFADIIIELSKVTKVNWITNGTLFTGNAFKKIINNANIDNIKDIVISVHISEIKNMEKYIIDYYDATDILNSVNIKYHTTTVVTDDNIDTIIQYKDFFPNLVVKIPFQRTIQNNTITYNKLSSNTIGKLVVNNLLFINDVNTIPPYTGKYCPNGSRIFEVHSNGDIYDCYYDANRIIIGNINIQIPITKLPNNRLCKCNSMHCIPALRDEYKLLN